jgi:hypothetical protein
MLAGCGVCIRGFGGGAARGLGVASGWLTATSNCTGVGWRIGGGGGAEPNFGRSTLSTAFCGTGKPACDFCAADSACRAGSSNFAGASCGSSKGEGDAAIGASNFGTAPCDTALLGATLCGRAGTSNSEVDAPASRKAAVERRWCHLHATMPPPASNPSTSISKVTSLVYGIKAWRKHGVCVRPRNPQIAANNSRESPLSDKSASFQHFARGPGISLASTWYAPQS